MVLSSSNDDDNDDAKMRWVHAVFDIGQFGQVYRLDPWPQRPFLLAPFKIFLSVLPAFALINWSELRKYQRTDVSSLRKQGRG